MTRRTPRRGNATYEKVSRTPNQNNKVAPTSTLNAEEIVENNPISEAKSVEKNRKQLLLERSDKQRSIARLKGEIFDIIEHSGSRTQLRKAIVSLETTLAGVKTVTENLLSLIANADCAERDYHQESEVYQLLERDVREITSLAEDHLESRIHEAASVAGSSSIREFKKKDNLDTIVEKELAENQLKLKRLEDDYKKAAEAAMMERRDIETRLRSSVKLERSFKPGKVVFKNGEVNRFIENLPVRRESDWIQDLIENQDISEDLPKHHRINSSVRSEMYIYKGEPLDWLPWSGLFYALVHNQEMSSYEKLGILRRSLNPQCQKVINGIQGDPKGYAKALGLLRSRYGNPEHLRAAYMRALRSQPVVIEDDAASFQNFADETRSYLAVLSEYCTSFMMASDLIQELLDKLPTVDVLAWKAFRPKYEEDLTLQMFDAWIEQRAEDYRRPGREPKPSKMLKQKTDRGFRAKSNATSTSREQKRTSGDPKRKCDICSEEHKSKHCSQFLNAPVEEKMEIAKRLRMCLCCLEQGHAIRVCRYLRECKIDGCMSHHNRSLHMKRRMETEVEKDAPTVNSGNLSLQPISANPKIALGVIRVTFIGIGGEKVQANALVDEGSDSSLMNLSLARRLGLSGKKNSLQIFGVVGNRERQHSEFLKVKIVSPSNDEIFDLNVWTLSKICASVAPVSWPEIQGRWHHLEHLELPSCTGRVDLLIGLDHAGLITPLEIRRGGDGDPYAVRTKLGWIARGIIGLNRSPVIRANFLQRDETPLDIAFSRFWDSERFGTESADTRNVVLSWEDQHALKTVEEGTIELPTGGYQVELPWKPGHPTLPNNRSIAENRFKSLLKKFDRNPEYEERYRKSIKTYLDSGYAQIIEENSEDLNNQWFLPHHGVFKKSSSEKKLRVVFDSAAEFASISLNKALLKGPPLQNELAGVLLKFRQKVVGVAADIEAMFSQIRLSNRDARYHRFLWKEKGVNKISTYQMNRLTFGDGPSPFIAIKTLHRTADDHGGKNKEAIAAIKKNFYVDDYLDSYDSPQEAIRIGSQIKSILKKGDFNLQKWISNSEEVRRSFGAVAVSETDIASSTETKVLGVKWKLDSDTFSFVVGDLQDLQFTKRGLLSKLAGLFDPLGLASPYTVKAKIRMQKLSITGAGWDDAVTANERKWWETWLKKLPELEQTEIPRCLVPTSDLVVSELHAFCDASEEAFAAAVYIRNVNTNGYVTCNLIMSKTRVAPKKTISVAKLELQAALLGVRVATTIQEELSIKITRRYFWTDSSCVRNWIRATASYYKPFVSHRIGEIQTKSDPSEWRHLPGRLNCSDLATRSKFEKPDCPIIPENWISGPDFLRLPETEWPKDLPVSTCYEESRPKCDYHLVNSLTTEPSSFKFQNFSTLIRAQRVMAYIIRFINIKVFHAPVPSTCLSLGEIDMSMKILLRVAQRDSFPEELEALYHHRDLKTTSKLLDLTPFIDGDGLMRIGGRIDNAPLPYESKHQVILEPSHALTKLIIEHYHVRECRHGGTNLVLSFSRQHYWILRGREAVKKVRRNCRRCIEENVKPSTQLMSALPIERLKVPMPPFYHTSADFFGPFLIVRGRNTVVKRYGCIFTCMTTRAVHVEAVDSLSTADFMNAFRRFISIRGVPETIYTDNGTNFVGAERKLVTSLKQLEADPVLREYGVKKKIKWIFQPPSAPHWGGVHESLVKSVKRTLYRTLTDISSRNRYLKEDEFRTLMAEITGFLNSRPLTYESSDVDDFRALTPNHFLLQRASASAPPGEFSNPNQRDHFKFIQHVSNLVWSRWIKEYLPNQIARQKWKLPERNFKRGDVVLVVDPNLPRGQWRLGRIDTVFPSKDGLVRAVKVRTAQGEFVRPVTRICLLESSSTTRPNRETIPTEEEENVGTN